MIVRYDYICPDEHRFEVVAQSGDTRKRACPQCRKKASYSPSFQAQPSFKPFDHPNLGPQPVRIESREHYARECEARGLNGPYNRSSEVSRAGVKNDHRNRAVRLAELARLRKT